MKKKKLKSGLLTLLIFLSTPMSFGDDDVYLQKNDPAPFPGYLMPKENYRECVECWIDRDAFKKAITEAPQYGESKTGYAVGGFVAGALTTILLIISIKN